MKKDFPCVSKWFKEFHHGRKCGELLPREGYRLERRSYPFRETPSSSLEVEKISIQNKIKVLQHPQLAGQHPQQAPFCQAREKVKPEFFKVLNEKTVELF